MNKSMMEDVLSKALGTGGDFSELFLEDRRAISMTSTGGKIDDIVSGREFGIGLRIFKGDKSVYAYTNDMTKENLYRVTAEAAAALSAEKAGVHDVNLNRRRHLDRHPVLEMPGEVAIEERSEIIRAMHSEAKSYDSRISQVQASLMDYDQNVTIANSEGLYVRDKRVRCRFSVNAVAQDGSRMNNGYYAPGAHKGFEFFRETDCRAYAREAARIAVTMLNATECPSGLMPVVIDGGFGGVIFHEACGHGLEATSVAKNASVYCGRIGTEVAGTAVTAIDDGTIQNLWGSANFDDEGTQTRKNILIENGILKAYLVDKLNSRKMDMPENGCARRQSYKYAPTSRMSNTYIAPGNSRFEDMISGIKHGIYAKNMGGGSVNPATGEFNFAVLEAYLIEDGKITLPVRGASLIGRGYDVLFGIDMVGADLSFGQGMCGSESGSVPAGVGQPPVRVKEILVGGGAK